MTLLAPSARPATRFEPPGSVDPSARITVADVPDGKEVPSGRPARSPLESVPRIASAVLALGLAALLLNLVLFSRVEHAAAQAGMYAAFRKTLAEGVAPVGQLDSNNRLLAPGTPVALLAIPSLGVQEVVGEGTTPELLTHGPGHLRNTVLPGGVGVSDVLARRAAYGGPFGGIAALAKGAEITVIDGLGQFTFRVIDVRRAGDPVPAPVKTGRSRLILITADGTSFVPSGVLRVDADLVKGDPVVAPLVGISLPRTELPMGTDASTLWQLVLWLEALLLVVGTGSWSWVRWGRAQTVIVLTGPTLLILYFMSDQVTRLLPNLL